jgi:glucokinase
VTDPTAPVLLADIGGTNTRVALARGGAVARGTIRRFANASHAGLPEILRTYMSEIGEPACAGACLAVAGPVQDGIAEMTNLDWTITPAAIRDATGAATVAIINDLQAQGHALDRLAPGAARTILPGAATPRPGARLVIGVGTGFNAAPVHRTRGGLFVAPSECGHAGLPVRTEADLRLARHVAEAHGFAGVEDVLSGRGLVRLHGWCAREAGQSSDLTAAAIMQAIGEGRDEIARRTAETFVMLLGRVAGDLALIHLPFEGIYLVGGVARAFAPHLGPMGFGQAFRDKGRFSDFLGDFPVRAIEDDFAALEGCADHLAQAMGR